MRRVVRSFWLLLIVVVWSQGDEEQSTALKKFDPFLQRQLSQDGYTHLFRHGKPEIPPSELAKLQAPDTPRYPVVIHGDDSVLETLGLHLNTRLDGFATARVTPADLLILQRTPGIDLVEKGGDMELLLDISVRRVRAHRVHDGEIMNIPFMGKDVIIGVIDTGIDIFHPDFRDPLDPGHSRVISIWDVDLQPIGNEAHPPGFDYGVEYTQEAINRELRGETQGAIRAKDTHGHGTHVAGIAGGNGVKSGGQFGGVAPRAEFIIVSFPEGRFQTARIIDAMSYIFGKAQQLGRPAVINMSFGGHGGAHDGTAGHELAINFYSEQQGRAFAVAAGNSGDDLIHQGGEIPPNESSEFTLKIPFYQTNLLNDDPYVLMFLWYESPGAVELTITTPTGYEIKAQSGDSVYVMTTDGAVEIDTFDDWQNPKGARLFLIDIHASNVLFPPRVGDWVLSVRNLSAAATAKFNTWIVDYTIEFNADAPIFEPNTGSRYTVTIPGTAEGAVTVGAYVSRRQWQARDGNTYHVPWAETGDRALFSSSGPTRDERVKPDIMAPGLVIAAPESGNATFSTALQHPQEGYGYLLGTSMAAPHLAGVIALIFEANPNLTGKEIVDIIRQSGEWDAWTGSTPNFDWGYGKVHAVNAFDHFQITRGIPEKFYLYQNFPNPFNVGTTIRFTIPEPTSGRLAVYDVLGRRVEVLIEGEFEPRVYNVPFDGSNLSSGVYFYRLETDQFSDVQKMILLR